MNLSEFNFGVLSGLTVIGLIGVALLYLRPKLPFTIFSPVWLFVGFYLIVIPSGLYVYEYTDWAYGIFHDLSELVDSGQLRRAGFKLLCIVGAFLFGANCYARSQPALAGKAVDGGPFTRKFARRFREGNFETRAPRILMGSLVPLALLTIGVGAENLIERRVYLPLDNQMAKTIGVVFSPAANIALGALFVGRNKWGWRMTALLIHLGFLIVFFSLASRSGAVTVGLFAVGMLMRRPDSKPVMVLAMVWVGIVGVNMALAFVLRALPEQGLIPFLDFIAANGIGALRHQSGTALGLFSFIGTFAVSVPLTAAVMDAAPLTLSEFGVSINPLPGVLTNWYEVAGTLKVTPYQPYNAVGELLNYGLSVAVAYFFLVGGFFARLDYRVRHLTDQQKLVTAAAVLGLTVMFTVISSQYNLRSATRVLYYLLIVDMGLLALPFFRRVAGKPLSQPGL